jgi:hypothetical protein
LESNIFLASTFLQGKFPVLSRDLFKQGFQRNRGAIVKRVTTVEEIEKVVSENVIIYAIR